MKLFPLSSGIHWLALALTPVPTMASPISLWPANGNATDPVGAHDGTLVGGVSYATGQFGQAFAFDGTGYVEIPHSPSLQLTTSLSIEFWARRTDLDSVDIVAEKGGDWTGLDTNYGVGLHSFPSVDRMFYFYFAGGWRGTPGVMDLDWHHYVVTAVDGAVNPAFYIDGSPVANVFSGGLGILELNASTAPLHLGAQTPSHPHFSTLLLDNFALYDGVLAPEQVAEHYLTDVASFTEVPEASTWAAGFALAALAGWQWQRGQRTQVERNSAR